MTTQTVNAVAQEDGSLLPPALIREALKARVGQEIRLTLTLPDASDPAPTDADPLLDIIGIGKGGPPDGAETHDDALYRRPTP